MTGQIKQIKDPSAGANTLLCSIGGSSSSYSSYGSWMTNTYSGEVSVDGYVFNRFYTVGYYALSDGCAGELKGDVYAVLKDGREVLLYNHYRYTKPESGQVETPPVFLSEKVPLSIDVSDISKIKIVVYHKVVYNSFHAYLKLYGTKSPWKAE